MATFLARKLFSRRVTIPSNQAISFADLMRSAPAVTGSPQWGKNTDGTPSMDSFTGDGGTLIPVSQTCYVGHSSQVSDVNGASTYIGVPVAAGDPYNLTDYFRAPIDTTNIFIYSRNAQECDLIFQGF